MSFTNVCFPFCPCSFMFLLRGGCVLTDTYQESISSAQLASPSSSCLFRGRSTWLLVHFESHALFLKSRRCFSFPLSSSSSSTSLPSNSGSSGAAAVTRNVYQSKKSTPTLASLPTRRDEISSWTCAPPDCHGNVDERRKLKKSAGDF